MAFLFGKLWAGLQALGGLLVPVVGYATGLRAWPTWMRWTAAVLVFAAVLVLLTFLNYWLDLEPRLQAPYALLRRVWLPLVFVLGWLLFLLGSWLWQLLGPEAQVSAWPDLDDAWSAATASLTAAGVDLTRVPVFLAPGRPEGGVAAVFAPAGLTLHGPGGGPVEVYAAPDAVYVACPGASLLATLSDAVRADADIEPPPPTLAPPPEFAPPAPAAEPARAVDPIVALLLGGTPPAATPAPSVTAAPSRPAERTAPAVRPEALLARVAAPGGDKARDGSAARLLRDDAVLQRDQSRLRHLCRLVARDRRPFCPLNGVLLLLPYRATDGETEVGQEAAAARQDLDAVRAAGEVDCPVLAMLVDIETAPGSAEFVGRLPASRRDLPLGQPFPLLPSLEAERVPAAVDEAALWMARSLLPMVTAAMFRPPTPDDPPADDAAVLENARLFAFAEDLRERLPRFARLAARAVLADPAGGRPLFGGCYLAATGREPAFAAGVLRRLVESQNAVRWTPEARAEEAAYTFWTRAALLGAALAAAAVVALLWALLV